MTKILISPGWGAGWTTWSGASLDADKFMLTHAGLIHAIESGEGVGYDEDAPNNARPGSALDQFVEDFKTAFPDEDVPYLGGARTLAVEDVDQPFRVVEYDGNEAIEYRDAIGWIDPADLGVAS